MKKSAILATILTLALTFTACTSGTQSSGSGPATSTAPAANAGDSEIVEIRLSTWRVEEIEAFKEINAAFMAQYPNIRPVYDAIQATEYDSKLSIDLNGGNASDLYYVRPFDRGRDLYTNGFLEAVTDDMAPNLANVSQLQKDVFKDKDDGALYAAPYIYINYGFMYNKTLFDGLGISAPETWDDFFAACETIKAAGTTPLAFGIKDSWIVSGSVSDSIFGAFVGGEAGRQKLLAGELKPTSPEMAASFETLARFADYVEDGFTGISYTDNVQTFAMGEAAIYPGGSFDLGFIQSQGLDFELGVFAPPVVNKGDTRWTSMNGGAGIGLNPKSEHKEEALIYMNWLMSEEAQVMIGNAAPGLFPCASIDASKLEDPLITDMINFGGQNGEQFTISWCMQLNGGNPTCTSLADDNLSLMLSGQLTPMEAAQAIETGVAAWYAPWQ